MDHSGCKDEADQGNEAPERASPCPAGDADHGIAFKGAALHGAREVYFPQSAQQKFAHVGKCRQCGDPTHGLQQGANDCARFPVNGLDAAQ